MLNSDFEFIDGVVQSSMRWNELHVMPSNGRKRVTAVHQANIMYGYQSRTLIAELMARKMSNGVYLSAYPEVLRPSLETWEARPAVHIIQNVSDL